MPNNESHPRNPKPACTNTTPHTPPPTIPTLPFAPQALFFALEVILCNPAPTSKTAQPLRLMLAHLEQEGMYGYFQLKVYMRHQSVIVREVRRVQRSKGYGGLARYSAGVRLLVDGVTFRDLATAYLEVVKEVERKKRREKVGVEVED